MMTKQALVHVLLHRTSLSLGELSGYDSNVNSQVFMLIDELKHEGYKIEYNEQSETISLLDIPPFLYAELLSYNLHNNLIGNTIYHYHSIDSTNTQALKFLSDDIAEGAVLVAETQTSGRGRMHRRWDAVSGKSILCSVVLRPTFLSHANLFYLTVIATLSVVQAIEAICSVAPSIKWPNDIMIGNKKCAGILTETISEGDVISGAVVGIGINVNQTESDFQSVEYHAASLKMTTNKEIDRLALLKQLLTCCDKNYNLLCNGFLKDLFNQWKHVCSSQGKRVEYSIYDTKESGIIESINPDGSLGVRLDNGTSKKIYSGHVRILS